MISFELVKFAGKFVKHIMGVLLLCWRKMTQAAAIAACIGFALAEALAAVVNRQFPPTISTHIVAMAFALALAYGVALTVLVDELVVSGLDTVRLLEGEAEAGVRAARIIAERGVGEAGAGFRRWFERSAASHSASGGGSAPRTRTRDEEDETLQAIAATEEFVTTAPRPRIDARPVPADRLPRIEWAREPAEQVESGQTAE